MVGSRRYLYHELATATSNFAEKNKLGQGGFGSVYKGHLLGDDVGGGQQVAIKKFSRESSQGRKEFEAEVKDHQPAEAPQPGAALGLVRLPERALACL
jgi:serine/threonine protein kinase